VYAESFRHGRYDGMPSREIAASSITALTVPMSQIWTGLESLKADIAY
jgi:hypothetical protein